MIKLVKNFFYNISYQILSLVLPLVTIPYISRVLGATGIGEYSFTYSNTQYFVLFGMLGISMYGSRTIAQSNTCKDAVSRSFWEVYFLQFLSCCIAYILFMLLFGLHSPIYFAQSFFIVGSIFDISWFFIGIEDFKKVVIRNTLVRLVGILLIFIFVKNESDIANYTYIMSLTTFVGQISMWINIRHFVIFRKLKVQQSFKHFKPTILLFLPQIASSVYILLDRSMLGVIHGDFDVGIYEQGQKIIRLAVAFITAISGVMMPRISNMIALKKIDEMKKIFETSSLLLWTISFGLTFGLLGISKDFVPWFFGDDYLPVVTVLIIGSWMIIPIAGANLFAIQYLIPINQQNKYTFSVIVSAIFNVILNIILIPRYSYIGATISTVLAEFTGVLIQIYFVRKEFSLKRIFAPIPKLLIAASTMYLSINLISTYIPSKVFSTIIEVVIGGFIYIIMLFITKIITLKSLKEIAAKNTNKSKS